MLEYFQTLFHIRTFGDFIVMLVDIAIVSYLVYRALLLIRGTKAAPVLLGLGLVIVSFFVSKDEYLGLSTLNWALDKFTAGFILLVIVIFQDDIRRALASVGRSRLLLGMGTPGESAQSVEEVVRACGALAAKKIGALIAIEREADLSDYAEEGIQIDARISNELLFSLFNPEHANPTHDGAVIIQGRKVAAAGCFLPLTSNPRIHKHLGTRHRAGIGLTEEADAVVCIVSEETGQVSVAFQGNLTRELDANTLRDVLQRLLTISASDEAVTKSKSAE